MDDETTVLFHASNIAPHEFIAFLSETALAINNQNRVERSGFLRGGKIRGVLDPRFLANGKRFRENRSVSVHLTITVLRISP